MKSKWRIAFTLVLALVCVVAMSLLVACQGSEDVVGAKGYTVSFVTDGGTTYNAVTTENAAQKIVLPIPEKFGNEFDGWYDNAEYAGNKLEGEYLPTKDITLYAKWTAKRYVVKLETFGGTEYADVVSDGSKIALPTPSIEDGTFDGWYLNADFSGEKLGETFTPTADATLYAKFIMAIRYTVTLEVNGGQKLAPLCDRGEGVTLPDAVKYGYAFDGWYLDEALGGEAISGVFHAQGDVTLYAKYHEIRYLYIYYGDYGETNVYDRFEVAVGTVIDLDDYLKQTVSYNGYELPVTGVTYDVVMHKGEAVSSQLEMSEDVYLVASVDVAPLPKDNAYTVLDGGAVRVRDKSIYVFRDDGVQYGAYTVKATTRKHVAGDALLAFRMIKSNTDNAYENAGDYYLAVGVKSSDGALEAYSVIDGVWSRLGNVPVSGAPRSWSEKFNSAGLYEYIDFSLTAYDHGNSLDILVDGEYAFSVDISEVSDKLVGTGYGMRSNSANTEFFDWQVAELKTVSFDVDGGAAIEPIKFAFGDLSTMAYTLKEGYVLEGWYTDEEKTNKIDERNFIAAEDVVLHANWIDAMYDVTLVKDGKVFAKLGYNDGALRLPNIGFGYNEANKFYTGWYYDEAFERKVDEYAPDITGDVTLYAGWRLPVDSRVTYDEKTGLYNVVCGSSNAVSGLVGVSECEYTEYQGTFDFKEIANNGRWVGLAFRMEKWIDNGEAADPTTTRFIRVDINVGTASDMGKVRIFNVGGEGYTLDKTVVAANGWGNKVKITVRDYGTYYNVYVDYAYDKNNDAYAARWTNFDIPVDSAAFPGKGYGVYANSAYQTFTVGFNVSEIPVHQLTLVKDGEIYEEVTYVDGAALPTPANDWNRIYSWFYDEACTQEFARTTATDATLYAGWKLPEDSHVQSKTTDGDVTTATIYEYNDGVAALMGVTNYAYTEYEAEFDLTVPTSNGRWMGLAFRMGRIAENGSYTDTAVVRYIAVDFNIADAPAADYGRVRIMTYGGENDVATAMSKVVGAYDAEGTKIGWGAKVRITVRDYGTYFDVSIDYGYDAESGEYAYEWSKENFAITSGFEYDGYGAHSYQTYQTYTASIKVSEIKTYKVTFMNGDSVHATIDYVEGSKLTLPETTPEKVGSAFVGWYYDEACTLPVDANDPQISGDTTIYAGFSEVFYDVTLSVDGETYGDVITIGAGTKTLDLPTLANDWNKIFAGWYYDQACTDLVDANDVKITGDATLYAGWRLPEDSHVQSMTTEGDVTTATIYEYKDGVAALMGVTNYAYTEYEAVFDLTVPTNNGRWMGLAFRMGRIAENGSYTDTAVVRYIAVDFNIADAPAADFGRVRILTYGGENDVATAMSKVVGAYDAEGTKMGWGTKVRITVRDYGTYFDVSIDYGYDAESGTYAYKWTKGNFAITSGFEYDGYGAHSYQTYQTYTASIKVSEIKTYKVTFMNGDSVHATIDYVEGSKLTLPETTPEKAGNVFDGWYYDEACTLPVEANAPQISGDTTIYAKFVEASYTVKFMDGDVEYSTATIAEGATLTLPDDPANDWNKMFAGWYSDEACTSPIAKDLVITQDTTIYAGWRLPTHTRVTYDAEAGKYKIDCGTTPGTSASCVLGITDYDYTEYQAIFDISTYSASSRWLGIAFRMEKKVDDGGLTAGEYAGSRYIALVINIGTGNDKGKARILTINDASPVKAVDNIFGYDADGNKALDFGSKVKMVIRDYGTYFNAYVHYAYNVESGEYAYCITRENVAIDNTIFTAKGYGVYSLNAGQIISVECGTSELKEYTVTLKDGNETVNTLSYVEKQAAIALPTLQDKEGLTFVGWYYDEACTLPVDVDSPAINGNVTLYAGWKATE